MQSFQKISEQNLPSTTCTIETLSSAATKAKKNVQACQMLLCQDMKTSIMTASRNLNSVVFCDI